MIVSTPSFMVAMMSGTGLLLVMRSDNPFEIGGMIATTSVMNCISCQAAPLWVDALFIQTPNGWTSSQWSGLTAWHGIAQKAVSLETLDWALSLIHISE